MVKEKTVKRAVKAVIKSERRKPKKVKVVVSRGLSSASARSRKPRRSSGRGSSIRGKFEAAMVYPDLIGPMRFPRSGSAERSVLGIDCTYFYANAGADTAQVFAFQMGTAYTDIGLEYFADVFADPLGAGHVTNVGLQFPALAQIEDFSLTTGCMVLSWKGPPLSASGEVIYGCGPAIGSSATYNTLLYYPGTEKIPLSALIELGSVRIPLRHMSPVSWEFVDKTADEAYVHDVETPFCCLYFTDPSQFQYLSIEIIRNWEIRPTLGTSAGAIPYDSSGPSFTADVNAFQDASNSFASAPLDATAGSDPTVLDRIYNYMSHPVTQDRIIRGSARVMGMMSGVASARAHYANLGGSALLPGSLVGPQVHDELVQPPNRDTNDNTKKDPDQDLIDKFKEILSPKSGKC